MMRIKNKLVAAGVITFIALAGQNAFAATNGTLGATSTGTALVSLSVSAVYQITGLTDLALGTWSGTGNMTGNSNVCVYTNDATAAYHVTATDNSTTVTNAFTLQGAGSTDIPFSLLWNNVSGTTGATAMTYNTAFAGTGANTTSTTCGGATDANYSVSILSTDLAAAPSGSYSTTLSLVVGP